MTQTISLEFPKPYGLQREIAKHPATRKVVCTGRRAGKTYLGAMLAVGGQEQYGLGKGMLDGKHVFLSSTSQDQADYFWEYITTWLQPLLDVKGFYKNESKRVIRFGNGQIKVKTGRNADALRGGYADVLILDECAYLDPDAWRKVGLPMLLDNEDSTAYLFSTPNRRNWFFEEYQKGLDPDRTNWKSWNFTSHANRYLSQTALSEIIEDMSEADYEQEIEAQFLESEGAVFRYVDERATLQPREPYTGRFAFGVDWAQKTDYTVIVVIDMDSKQMVAYDRFNKVDWALQRGRLATLYNAWEPKVILAEENSIGSPNIEALRREGLVIDSFMTTAVSKPPLIENLVLAFDRGEVSILNDDYLKNELKAYEKLVSPKTGRSSYSSPVGLHDDMVMALALAWKVASEPRRVIDVIEVDW